MVISPITSEIAWKLVQTLNRKEVRSTSRGVVYRVKTTKNVIYYSTDSRNAGEPEVIYKSDFLKAYDAIRGLEDINTNRIKKVVPTTLYRQRSPLIAILCAAGVLVRAKV